MKLIEVDKLQSQLSKYGGTSNDMPLVRKLINKLPQIELVSCEKCSNWVPNVDGTNEPWCLKFGYDTNADDYCSYGEKI